MSDVVRTDTAKLYTYSPIRPPKTFRLLRLFGSASRESPLQGQMVHASLDDHPVYRAISYTWEGQASDQTMFCEGATLLITKNCEEALKSLRPVHGEETRHLWIDSVCINQEKEGDAQMERQGQVAMMGSIYKAAESVIAWLGDPTTLHPRGLSLGVYDTTIQWLSRLAQTSAEAAVGTQRARIQELLYEIDAAIPGQDLIATFLHIPWFKRLWVIQEIALSNQGELFFGKTGFRMDNLLQAREVIKDMAKGNFRAFEVFASLNNGFCIHGRAEACVAMRPTVDAAELMEEARYCLTTLVQDKVYALYGIFNALNLNLPFPDYSKPTAQIFRETAIGIAIATGNLNVFDQVHGLGSTANLASWVPDWATFKHAIPPALGITGSRVSSADSSPEFWFEANELHLAVRGINCDVIFTRSTYAVAHQHEGLGRPEDYIAWSQNFQPPEIYWKNLLKSNPRHSQAILRIWNIRVFQMFSKFAFDTSDRPTDKDTRMEFYATLLSHEFGLANLLDDTQSLDTWHSILMGTASRPPPLQTDQRDVVNSWMKSTIDEIRQTPKLQSLLTTPEFAVFEAIELDDAARQRHDNIIRRSFYQTIFRTKSGRLGMAPHPIRSGDEIKIFAGGRFPMVVRPSNGRDTFRLISPAYIHGIMQGQAWLPGGNDLQKFIIE
ncbi:heterokaryon incompatibility protein-domain-containing protein [Nemania sp. FL0031]|nr:heterokaryon incompatibility protein-domain-containing protein [Nemania sp. FL0031]